MKRTRPHPPASPRDAERAGDVPRMTAEEMDAFFNCRHGHDSTLSRCLSCLEETAERRAQIELEIFKEGETHD